MNVLTRRLLSAALVSGALISAAPAFAQNDMAEVQTQMAEARRRFEGLDYEQAVPALDRVIAILGTRLTPDTRRLLADAYEMRARSRFGLGDQTGTRDDLVSLLKVDQARTLTGQISPRVIAIFDEARKATVTSATLIVSPANAEVTLDGAPIAANASIPILVGDHTLTAKRLGYKTGVATFTAAPNATTEASLTLARESAVLAIMTTPADVEVLVDGVARGKTVAGPPTPDYADRAARAGVPLAQVSAALVLADIPAGAHRIEFRRGCFVTAERRMDITQLEDLVLDPVKLDPAVATIVAGTAQSGANVYVDGTDKGAGPVTTELCEGEHLVELRSPLGRFTQRVNARAGQRVEVAGTLRPAFALVSAGAQGALGTDLRTVVERALEPVRGVLVFAPPADKVDQALKASQLPPDWLSFDANKRPLGVSADISAPMRRDLSARIAKAFDAQGVASVSVPVPANRNRVVLTLLGSGSSEPDVIELSLDRPDTIADAVTLLDRPLSFWRPSIGLAAIDVADVTGAVVVAVDANGPAAKAAVLPGEVVVRVGEQPVNDSAALATALAGKKANDNLSLEVKNRAGASRRVEVRTFMTPRLISMNDQMLLANRVLADLRARLAAPAAPEDDSIIRLNVAAALARLQSWGEARVELQKVKLAEGPGVGNGTVQYLLGLCADSLGNRSEAEVAWRIAASSESFLTEDGPPVKELAEAKIAELQRRGTAR